MTRPRSTVLIVEDEPIVLKAIDECLSEQGYFVGLASTGQQAMMSLQLRDWDIVLLDVGLGEFDRTVLMSELEVRSVPYVVMSGLVYPADILLIDPDRFLEKPFAIVELLRKMRSMLLQSQRSCDSHLPPFAAIDSSN